MNTKIAGITIFVIIIGIGIVYAVFNSLVDTNESDVQIESSTINSESLSNPIVSDDAIINTENQNYDVNEDGKRHYTLIAKTEPIVSP